MSGASPETVPQPSLGDLFSELSRDFGQLVRDEVQLAKTEVTDEVRVVARASGVLGVAAYAAVTAILLLSFAAAWGLAELMPIGFAFLIVGIVWAVVGAIAFMYGRKQLEAVNLKPEQTIATLQEDVKWAKQQTS
jgi:hypothetical protein